MKPKLITAGMLLERGACSNFVDIFRQEWPNGGRVTLRNITRAQGLKLDIDWFAKNFLATPAREVYEKATATAREAYRKATAPARKAYDEATATALKAYNEATATALKAYNEATATAFYKAWQSDRR